LVSLASVVGNEMRITLTRQTLLVTRAGDAGDQRVERVVRERCEEEDDKDQRMNGCEQRRVNGIVDRERDRSKHCRLSILLLKH
jgi:hypothetical protein